MQDCFRILTAISLCFVLWSCAENQATVDQLPTTFDPSRSDAAAVRIAEKMLQAVGAEQFEQAAKFISFRYILRAGGQIRVERTHLWNRTSGDYQIEWQDRDGDSHQVKFNLNGNNVQAMLNGRAITATLALKEYLQRAFAVFANDTYWLLAPFKVMDPGAELHYLGREEIDDRPCETIKLTFDRVGLTPQNQLKLYIDAETFRLLRWDFYKTASAEPRPAVWSEWKTLQGMQFALSRKIPDTSVEIAFQDLYVSDTPELSKFLPELSANETADK